MDTEKFLAEGNAAVSAAIDETNVIPGGVDQIEYHRSVARALLKHLATWFVPEDPPQAPPPSPPSQP